MLAYFFYCCFFPSILQVTGLPVIRRTYFANSPKSYLIHHPTCCRSRSQWASVLSSHDWTLRSCDGTLPSPVQPTAGWHDLGTAVPLGLSRHQNQRWANSPSVGGPGQDSREREPGVESAMAHTLPARPVWSYRLRGGAHKGSYLRWWLESNIISKWRHKRLHKQTHGPKNKLTITHREAR